MHQAKDSTRKPELDLLLQFGCTSSRLDWVIDDKHPSSKILSQLHGTSIRQPNGEFSESLVRAGLLRTNACDLKREMRPGSAG